MTKKKKPKTPTASIETVFRWFEEFEEGVFQVLADPIEVFKGERKLAQRINLRQRMDDGDARVDLWHEGLRWRQLFCSLIKTNQTKGSFGSSGRNTK